MSKRRQTEYAASECIYPAIRDWMQNNNCNFSALADMSGVCNQTISRTLRGASGASKYTIDQILRVTGLTYEEAFATEPGEEGR